VDPWVVESAFAKFPERFYRSFIPKELSEQERRALDRITPNMTLQELKHLLIVDQIILGRGDFVASLGLPKQELEVLTQKAQDSKLKEMLSPQVLERVLGARSLQTVIRLLDLRTELERARAKKQNEQPITEKILALLDSDGPAQTLVDPQQFSNLEDPQTWDLLSEELKTSLRSHPQRESIAAIVAKLKRMTEVEEKKSVSKKLLSDLALTFEKKDGTETKESDASSRGYDSSAESETEKNSPDQRSKCEDKEDLSLSSSEGEASSEQKAGEEQTQENESALNAPLVRLWLRDISPKERIHVLSEELKEFGFPEPWLEYLADPVIFQDLVSAGATPEELYYVRLLFGYKMESLKLGDLDIWQLELEMSEALGDIYDSIDSALAHQRNLAERALYDSLGAKNSGGKLTAGFDENPVVFGVPETNPLPGMAELIAEIPKGAPILNVDLIGRLITFTETGVHHPREVLRTERKARYELFVNELRLPYEVRQALVDLVGPRFQEKRGTIKFTCDDFPTDLENQAEVLRMARNSVLAAYKTVELDPKASEL
jgi:hypothetical protein